MVLPAIVKVTFTNPGRNRAGPEGGFSGCSVSLPTTPIVASRKYLLCDETIVDPQSRRPFRKAARNSTKASHQGRPSLSAQPGMPTPPPLGKDHTGSLLKWGRASQGSGKFGHPLPQDCVMPSRASRSWFSLPILRPLSRALVPVDKAAKV